MSAARVALDVLLTADDPGEALGELLALATKIPAIADTLPDHCRIAGRWQTEHAPAGCLQARRDALNWGLLCEVRAMADGSYQCNITAYACDEVRHEPSVYRSTPEAARAYCEQRLVELGWRLLS